MPTSIKTIGREAFRFCKNLKEIEIPYGVEVINDYTFFRLRKIT